MSKNKIYQDGTIEDVSNEYFNFNRDAVDFFTNRDKFIYYSDTGMQMSCRVESRKGSGNNYWSAYKRVNGKLNKRYLGSAEQISIETLEQVCIDICKSESKTNENSSVIANGSTSEKTELAVKLDEIITYIERQQAYLSQVPDTSKTGQKRGDTPRYKHSLQLVNEIAAMLSD